MPTEVALVDELVKWGTFGGAVIAGITGAYTGYIRWREQRDWICVGLGPAKAEISPHHQMHVFNVGSRKVVLSDLGFILEDGRLFSALMESELEPMAWGGQITTELGPSEYTSPWCEGYGGLNIVGAYAMTMGNEKFHIFLSPALPLLTRFRLRLKRWRHRQDM